MNACTRVIYLFILSLFTYLWLTLNWGLSRNSSCAYLKGGRARWAAVRALGGFPAGLRRVQTGSPGPERLTRTSPGEAGAEHEHPAQNSPERAGRARRRLPQRACRGSRAPARGSRLSGQREGGWGYSPGRGWPCQAGTFHSGPAFSPFSAPRRESRRDFPESVSVQGVEME